MEDYSIFQIMGPVMIGPSSSHTAGSCKIGNVAKNIFGEGFTRVDFYLHGSFASTYKGHGTDRALLAGVLGISPQDEKLIHSFALAREQHIDYQFHLMDLGDVHPNSVKVVLEYPWGERKELVGSSIGGGNIIIVEIEGNSLLFKNQFPTVVLQYEEQQGVIARVSKQISEAGYNIESINTEKKGNFVTLLIELSEELEEALQENILSNDKFIFS